MNLIWCFVCGNFCEVNGIVVQWGFVSNSYAFVLWLCEPGFTKTNMLSLTFTSPAQPWPPPLCPGPRPLETSSIPFVFPLSVFVWWSLAVSQLFGEAPSKWAMQTAWGALKVPWGWEFSYHLNLAETPSQFEVPWGWKFSYHLNLVHTPSQFEVPWGWEFWYHLSLVETPSQFEVPWVWEFWYHLQLVDTGTSNWLGASTSSRWYPKSHLHGTSNWLGVSTRLRWYQNSRPMELQTDLESPLG